MKKLFTFSFIFITSVLSAQKPYFQQKLDYDISVNLDDVKHTLSGIENLTYQNNSSDTLHEIYFHLYYNAFNGSSTAYTRQLNRVSDASFSFAKADQLGGYNKFEVKIDDKLLEVSLEKDNPDIAKIILKEPLLPNKKIALHVNFEEKIPFAFSRPGHIDQQYLITQWYPKPAVYDASGWHTLPCLENGEYYGEFGTFDVKITLPENYVVAATGELQTDSERAFIAQKANKPFPKTSQKNIIDDTFPTSSTKNKTIQFTASNVHDFGWFADKRFRVVSEKIEKCAYTDTDVVCDVYFTPRDSSLWKKAALYARKAVEYYGTRIGKYPFSHASVVAQYDKRGGGMEYPMITVIGGASTASDLESVVVHEVGHNWFYGILGSNERDNGWMDEGINTYYENCFSDEIFTDTFQKLPANFIFVDTTEPGFKKRLCFLKCIYDNNVAYFSHQTLAPLLSSDTFNNKQYGEAYYFRPSKGLKTLEGFVGRKKFDATMQKYFTKWKFKHPQPEDFKRVLNLNLGDSINWFFNDIIGTARTSAYSIHKINKLNDKYEVTIKNTKGIATPFSLSATLGDTILSTQWYSGTDSIKTVLFNQIPKAQNIILDAYNVLPQSSIGNKSAVVKADGMAKVSTPLKIKFFSEINFDPRKNIVQFSSLVGFNTYDKFMVGVDINNMGILQKPFEWSVFPLYSFNTNAVRGIGQFDYTFFNKKSEFVIGGEAKSFATSDKKENIDGLNRADFFTRYGAKFRWNINRNSASTTKNSIQLRQLLINQKNFFPAGNGFIEGDAISNGFATSHTNLSVTELSYINTFSSPRSATYFNFTIEVDKRFGALAIFYGNRATLSNYSNNPVLRINAEYKYDYSYNAHSKVYTRFYVGTAIGTNNGYSGEERIVSLIQQGINDYKFDAYYFGRNEFSGKWSQQVSEDAQGGMKIILPNGYQNDLGKSTQFIASLNTKIDVPFKLPADFKIQPYLDFGYFSAANNYTNLEPSSLLVSGGISVSIPNYFAMYVPLYFSGGACKDDPNGLSCIMSNSNFLQRIAFSFNVNNLLLNVKNKKLQLDK